MINRKACASKYGWINNYNLLPVKLTKVGLWLPFLNLNYLDKS